ncbi:MAG TPA: tetratricopeptide repeat protein [Bauldia sp.]|nr:tetratricopeptide repeat protein [Bauldia sp.]
MRLTARVGAIIAAGLLFTAAAPALADTAADLAACKTADEIRYDADVKAACDSYLSSGEGSAADQADAYFGRARVVFANGDADAAIADLDRAIELHPTGEEYLYRGGYRDTNDDYDGMMADYDIAVRDYPSADAYSLRGTELYFDAEYDKALADFDAALKLDPKFGDALRLRAKTLAELGRRDEAIAAAGDMLAADPKSREAYRLRPVLYMEKGEPAKALDDYNAAVALFPDWEFHDGRADVYMTLGEPQKAVEDLKVLLANAESPSLYARMVSAYVAAGDTANADAAFDKGLQLANAALAKTGYNADFAIRARLYVAMKRYDYALSDLNSAIILAEEDPTYFYEQRAKVYDAIGNADKAAADRATIKQLNDAAAAAGKEPHIEPKY